MTLPFTAHAKAADLASGLRYVAVAVAKKPPVALLAGVMLTASEDGITLSAFDYETSATITIPGVGEGTALVHHAQLTTVLKGAGKNETIGMDSFTDGMYVDLGGLTAIVEKFNIDDYPALPKMGEPIVRIGSCSTFDAVNSATCRDFTLPTLCGVRFSTDPILTTVTLAATDRYRLVESVVESESMASVESFTVPFKSVAHVAKNFKDGVSIHSSHDDVVIFVDDTKTLGARTIDAAFPRYQSLIPTEHFTSQARVDSTTVIAAVKRVATTIGKSDLGRGIAVEILPDGMWIGSLRIPANTDGESFTFRISPQYMIDALAAVGPGDVTVSCFAPKTLSGLRPVLFTNDRGVRAIVMPIQPGAE